MRTTSLNESLELASRMLAMLYGKENVEVRPASVADSRPQPSVIELRVEVPWENAGNAGLMLDIAAEEIIVRQHPEYWVNYDLAGEGIRLGHSLPKSGDPALRTQISMELILQKDLETSPTAAGVYRTTKENLLRARSMRKASHEERDRDLERREKKNPTLTREELDARTFWEALEPEVRGAIRILRQKGISTTSSGWYGEPYPVYSVIDGHGITPEQAEAVEKSGLAKVTHRSPIDSDPREPAQFIEGGLNHIWFPIRGQTRKEIKTRWDEIARLTPSNREEGDSPLKGDRDKGTARAEVRSKDAEEFPEFEVTSSEFKILYAALLEILLSKQVSKLGFVLLKPGQTETITAKGVMTQSEPLTLEILDLHAKRLFVSDAKRENDARNQGVLAQIGGELSETDRLKRVEALKALTGMVVSDGGSLRQAVNRFAQSRVSDILRHFARPLRYVTGERQKLKFVIALSIIKQARDSSIPIVIVNAPTGKELAWILHRYLLIFRMGGEEDDIDPKLTRRDPKLTRKERFLRYFKRVRSEMAPRDFIVLQTMIERSPGFPQLWLALELLKKRLGGGNGQPGVALTSYTAKALIELLEQQEIIPRSEVRSDPPNVKSRGTSPKVSDNPKIKAIWDRQTEFNLNLFDYVVHLSLLTQNHGSVTNFPDSELKKLISRFNFYDDEEIDSVPIAPLDPLRYYLTVFGPSLFLFGRPAMVQKEFILKALANFLVLVSFQRALKSLENPTDRKFVSTEIKNDQEILPAGKDYGEFLLEKAIGPFISFEGYERLFVQSDEDASSLFDYLLDVLRPLFLKSEKVTNGMGQSFQDPLIKRNFVDELDFLSLAIGKDTVFFQDLDPSRFLGEGEVQSKYHLAPGYEALFDEDFFKDPNWYLGSKGEPYAAESMVINRIALPKLLAGGPSSAFKDPLLPGEHEEKVRAIKLKNGEKVFVKRVDVLRSRFPEEEILQADKAHRALQKQNVRYHAQEFIGVIFDAKWAQFYLISKAVPNPRPVDMKDERDEKSVEEIEKILSQEGISDWEGPVRRKDILVEEREGVRHYTVIDFESMPNRGRAEILIASLGRAEVRTGEVRVINRVREAEKKGEEKGARHLLLTRHEVVERIVEAVMEGRRPARAAVRRLLGILQGKSWPEIEGMMKSAARQLLTNPTRLLAIAWLEGNLLSGPQISPNGEIYGDRRKRGMQGLVPVSSSPVGNFAQALVAEFENTRASA